MLAQHEAFDAESDLVPADGSGISRVAHGERDRNDIHGLPDRRVDVSANPVVGVSSAAGLTALGEASIIARS